MTTSEMNEHELLKHIREKIDHAPALYRAQVAAILEPVADLLERMVKRLDELGEVIDG